MRIIVRVENTTTILATVEPTQNKKNEKGRIQKRGGRKIKQETLIHNGAGVSSPIAAAVGEQQKLEINIINNLFVCEIHNVTDMKDHYEIDRNFDS